MVRPTTVIDLDADRFGACCAELLRRAAADQAPDALIAIPTGGLFVAEAMRCEADGLPVLSLTCRRPTTQSGLRSRLARGAAATLPRSILDRLRVAEHAWLTRRRTGAAAAIPHAFSAGEVAALRVWLTGAGRRPSLLVVDDAVDSGVTLSRVLAAVAGLAPPGAEIRSAVIAVTTESRCVEPTYALYRQRLCRFPWSIDAPTPTRS